MKVFCHAYLNIKKHTSKIYLKKSMYTLVLLTLFSYSKEFHSAMYCAIVSRIYLAVWRCTLKSARYYSLWPRKCDTRELPSHVALLKYRYIERDVTTRQINNSCLIEWCEKDASRVASRSRLECEVKSRGQICEANRLLIMPALHTHHIAYAIPVHRNWRTRGLEES